MKVPTSWLRALMTMPRPDQPSAREGKKAHLILVALLLLVGGGIFSTRCERLSTQRPAPASSEEKASASNNERRAADDWFAFVPGPNGPEGNPLDLRSLNQVYAGEQGRVVVRDGHLAFERGTHPVRFWGNNGKHRVLGYPPEKMRDYVRFLAQRGVNLLRIPCFIYEKDDPRKVVDGKIRSILQLAAFAREEGIYLGLSLFFPLDVPLGPQSGIEGYDGEQPFSLPYFSKGFSRIYESWWKALLTTPHETTGRQLKDDPTLAYIELINEDSTLFWTFKPYDVIPEQATIALEKQFGAWLAQRYDSAAGALRFWGGEHVRGDRPAEGRVGFLSLHEILEKPDLRAQDTAEFLTRIMRNTYTRWARFLRYDVGYEGLTVCSNWKTADARRLDGLDNWANLACDLMDHHGYMGGDHQGEKSHYRVESGQRYFDRSGLRFDAPLSGEERSTIEKRRQFFPILLEPKFQGKPAIVSEVGWPNPNRFRTEGALFSAAYGTLHQIDAVLPYQSSATTWLSKLDKFDLADPSFFGQYAVAARLFRHRMLRPGSVVGRVTMSNDTLFSLRAESDWGRASYDPLRQNDLPGRARPAEREVNSLDPLALLVGPIEVLFEQEETTRWEADLSDTINRTTHTVSSNTGEIHLHFRQGLLEIAGAQVEALVGFYESSKGLQKEGSSTQRVLSTQMENEYGSVALISLDERPLRVSARMLLQLGTETKNTGFETRTSHSKAEDTQGPPAPFRDIVEWGDPPLLVRKVRGTFRLVRPDTDELTLTPLSPLGAKLGAPRVLGPHPVRLAPDVLYYLIEKGDFPRHTTR